MSTETTSTTSPNSERSNDIPRIISHDALYSDVDYGPSPTNKREAGVIYPVSRLADSTKTTFEKVANGEDEKQCYITDFKLSIHSFRHKCGEIVNHEYVQTCILILIIVNSVMMGIDTLPAVRSNEHISHAFHLTDNVFLFLFTVELSMQLIYHGQLLFYDGWLVFDFFIVLLSWVFHNLQIIRAFRIIRALRLINHVTLIRKLVEALLCTIPRMAGITAMLLLVFYVFAVMFTQLFKSLDLEEPYFVTLDASFFTLFQIMTLDWAGVARECMEVYSWAWAPFVLFVFVSSFVVFNLIIAVICDSVAFASNEEDWEEEKRLFDKVQVLSERVAELTMSEQRIQHSLSFLARQVQMTQVGQQLAKQREQF